MNKTSKTSSKPSASIVTPQRHALRGPDGRFVSNAVKTAKTTKSKTSATATSAPKSTATIKSSFISKMTVIGNEVEVVMSREPKIVYVYAPTATGLRNVKNVLKSNGSLGTVYNTDLKGREVRRVIYK
jgi:hypothetical protein